MLFRGVNKALDEENGGRLVPQGSNVETVPTFDGSWRLDAKFFLGPCQSNTARAHQIKSGLYGGCGISTSRSEEKAIFFATSGHTEDGYVYVIDEHQLSAANVTCHEFSDSEHLHEVEVTLIEQSGCALPESVVLEKYEVNADGSRK